MEAAASSCKQGSHVWSVVAWKQSDSATLFRNNSEISEKLIRQNKLNENHAR
jgi:hypothetical protein